MEDPISADTSEAARDINPEPEKVEENQEKFEDEPEKIEGREHGTDGEKQEKGETEQEKLDIEQEKVTVEKIEAGQEIIGEEHVINEEDRTKLERERENVEKEYQENIEVEEQTVPEQEKRHAEESGETVRKELVDGEITDADQDKANEVKVEAESKATKGELLGEEVQLIYEEPPPDPAAPYNLSDSQEELKLPFKLRPDQLIEVEHLWQMFQDYTPAYSNLDQFITAKELVYMLKALLLMTYTPEQMTEMIEFCVRPPHPKGHVNYEQFLKIVTMRQRDFVMEEQIRQALCVFDPTHSGIVNREEIREAMTTLGMKLPNKIVDNFIKEVDITGDGELGIEDIVGTMCIDLNQEDLQMLRDQVNPPVVIEEPNVDKWESQTGNVNIPRDDSGNA